LYRAWLCLRIMFQMAVEPVKKGSIYAAIKNVRHRNTKDS